MNGDEVLEREIGDIINGVQSGHGAKTCEAHDAMKQGVVKSLRLCESTHKMQRLNIIIAIGILLSVWFKGGDFTETALKVVGSFVKSSIGQTAIDATK